MPALDPWLVCAGKNCRSKIAHSLYRLTTFGTIFEHSPPKNWYRSTTILDVWKDLEARSGVNRSWIPLSTYTTPTLTGKHGFTWWSSLDFSDGICISKAHQAGLVNEYIGVYSVLLMLDLEDYRGPITVPTILDGFDWHLFNAMHESEDTNGGVAIDCRQPEKLCLGASEFVIQDIPVTCVRCLPVLIDEEQRNDHRVEMTSDFISHLISFHRATERRPTV